MKPYQQTLEWLFAQLPMYQRVGGAAYKADLSKTWELIDHLDHPQDSFPAVHIAGTNGKGSVSHMLASVLQTAGYRVGLYTSPHLKDFRERIRVDGQMIPEDNVVNFVESNKAFLTEGGFSFFEMTVGMAFDHFRREKVDIAVVEVGMGGRLDSTNVVNPIVCAITNIGFDHIRFLGDTLPKIAGEKAGIIKQEVPVVIGRIQSDTRPVFETVASQMDAPIYFAEESDIAPYPSDLEGSYQIENQRTALKVLALLEEAGWKISNSAIASGLQSVTARTGLMGRWQILQKEPLIICDTAHNKEGLELVLAELAQQDYSQLYIVLGTLNDKDLRSILPLFPKDAYYFYVTPSIPRALPAVELAKEATEFGLEGAVVDKVLDGLKEAKRRSSKDDLIFVGGSTFVVAEVM